MKHLPAIAENGGWQVENPAARNWPATLALEIAMQVSTPKEVCRAYEITSKQWDAIRKNPVFVSELTSATEALRLEGASFRARAQMMSLELLKDIWTTIRDPDVSLAIRVDLIKFVVRIAGLDASKEQGMLGKLNAAGGGGFALNIVLGNQQINVGT